MAQKPVPNALTLELTDVVAENIDRHRDTAELWYAHEHVPYDEGENFAFLRLFLGAVGDDDAAGRLFLGLDATDENAVVQGTELRHAVLS